MINIKNHSLIIYIVRNQLRIVCATFHGKYQPNDCYDETYMTTTFNKLSLIVRNILKHNIEIIIGDVKALEANYENNKFYWHNFPKRNCKYLAIFSHENYVAYLDTKLQKRERMLWTNIFI